MWRQCSADEREAAFQLLPEGQKLLDNFVDYYWTAVIAPALSRAQLAEGLEIVERLRRQERLAQSWKPSGSRIHDAMSRPRARTSAEELQKLTTIAERALGKRAFAPKEERRLKAPGRH